MKAPAELTRNPSALVEKWSAESGIPILAEIIYDQGINITRIQRADRVDQGTTTCETVMLGSISSTDQDLAIFIPGLLQEGPFQNDSFLVVHYPTDEAVNAEVLFAALQGIMAENGRPYALMGISMGALLAAELAYRIHTNPQSGINLLSACLLSPTWSAHLDESIEIIRGLIADNPDNKIVYNVLPNLTLGGILNIRNFREMEASMNTVNGSAVTVTPQLPVEVWWTKRREFMSAEGIAAYQQLLTLFARIVGGSEIENEFLPGRHAESWGERNMATYAHVISRFLLRTRGMGESIPIASHQTISAGK